MKTGGISEINEFFRGGCGAVVGLLQGVLLGKGW